MSRPCHNCQEPTETGIMCPTCAAVLDIRYLFEDYARTPMELASLLDDLESNGVETAERMHEMAVDRNAFVMRNMARKCLDVERRASVQPGTFGRALKALRRHQKPASSEEIDRIMGATFANIGWTRGQEEI